MQRSPDIEKLEQLTRRMNATEASLYKHQNELSEFFVHAPLPMWIKDLKGNMLFINNSYAEHYGMKPDDYAGVNDAVFWGERRAKQFQENDRLVATTGNQHVFEENIKTAEYPDGIVIQVIKWPVRNANEIIAIAGMVVGKVENAAQ